MAYEQKPGSGSLFKNDRKENDKHPDYKGTYKHHDGTEFNVAIWVKEGKKGKFLSLSTSNKQTNGNPKTTSETNATNGDHFDLF